MTNRTPDASATWWALGASDLAARLMRHGGQCHIETPGDLYDVTLADGRVLLGCRPDRAVPGERPGPIVIVESPVGSFSLVTGSLVVSATLCSVPLTSEPVKATLPSEGQEQS